MELIKKAIRQIAKEEYIRANEKFPLFNSNHEGIAVIEEEMLEADVDWENTTETFRDLKISVFTDDDMGALIDAENVKNYAINACAELIQVIAMCDKFIESHNKRQTKC